MGENWPDPSIWVSDLLHQLKGLDAVFLTYEGIKSKRLKLTQDDMDRRGIIEPVEPEITHQYTRAVSRVIEALELLPPFAKGEGLIALKTLRMDLDTLDEGSKPARLKARTDASVGAMNKGRRKARAHIVSYVLLLEEVGLENADARDTVVRIFGEHGTILNASTIYGWTDRVRDAAGRRLVARNLAEWRADDRWPFSREDAEKIIGTMAAGVSISLALTT